MNFLLEHILKEEENKESVILKQIMDVLTKPPYFFKQFKPGGKPIPNMGQYDHGHNYIMGFRKYNPNEVTRRENIIGSVANAFNVIQSVSTLRNITDNQLVTKRKLFIAQPAININWRNILDGNMFEIFSREYEVSERTLVMLEKDKRDFGDDRLLKPYFDIYNFFDSKRSENILKRVVDTLEYATKVYEENGWLFMDDMRKRVAEIKFEHPELFDVGMKDWAHMV